MQEKLRARILGAIEHSAEKQVNLFPYNLVIINPLEKLFNDTQNIYEPEKEYIKRIVQDLKKAIENKTIGREILELFPIKLNYGNLRNTSLKLTNLLIEKIKELLLTINEAEEQEYYHLLVSLYTVARRIQNNLTNEISGTDFPILHNFEGINVNLETDIEFIFYKLLNLIREYQVIEKKNKRGDNINNPFGGVIRLLILILNLNPKSLDEFPINY